MQSFMVDGSFGKLSCLQPPACLQDAADPYGRWHAQHHNVWLAGGSTVALTTAAVFVLPCSLQEVAMCLMLGFLFPLGSLTGRHLFTYYIT
jgi:hypothetical protein